MKNQTMAVVCSLLILSCQKSNSSPADSGNSNPGDVHPKPPVATVPASPAADEWQKKLEACPLKLSQDMSLEQVAETSSQMRRQCGFTENDWAQVVRHL